MKNKRYLLELGAGLGAYAITLVLSLRLLNSGIHSETIRIAISLLPILPAIAICWSVARKLGRLDEMQRKLQIEALGMAFAGTALVTFSYGFLENAGFPRVSMFAVWPLMAGFWVLGAAIGRLRYR